MIKILGLLLIVSSMSLAGRECAGMLKKRISSLEAIIRMIDSLEIRISEFSTPLPVFFSSYSDKVLDSCLFISAIRESGLSDAIDLKASELALKEEEINILKALAERLGTLCISEEVRHCRYARKELEHVLSAAKEALPLHDKLLKSVGVMCAILAAVLFI